jgi:hypothetical protein
MMTQWGQNLFVRKSDNCDQNNQLTDNKESSLWKHNVGCKNLSELMLQ